MINFCYNSGTYFVSLFCFLYFNFIKQFIESNLPSNSTYSQPANHSHSPYLPNIHT